MFGIGRRNERPEIKAMRERMEKLQQGQSLDPNAKRVNVSPVSWPMLASGLALATIGAAGIGMLAPGGISLRLSFLGGEWNELLFSAAPKGMFGDPVLDGVYVALARGLALCFAAGFFPLCAFVWLRLRDLAQSNNYVALTGVTVGVPFTYLFVKDFFWPLLKDVFEVLA